MLILILLIVLLAAFLYALYFGYRLAFQYEDPLNSPYNYPDTDQTRKVKPVLDPAIAAFTLDVVGVYQLPADEGGGRTG